MGLKHNPCQFDGEGKPAGGGRETVRMVPPTNLTQRNLVGVAGCVQGRGHFPPIGIREWPAAATEHRSS